MAKKKSKGKKSSGMIWLVVIVVVLVVGGFFLFSGGKKYSQEELDKFANCISDSGAKMYGAFWCPKCAKQKKMFGSSVQYFKEIECDPRGENEQSELCIEKNVEKYPDWEFADGSRKVGILSFEELAEETGCAMPVEN
jgi:thiol-disulfide isomerase/thioredoxin